MDKVHLSAPSQGSPAAWFLLWKGNGLVCELRSGLWVSRVQDVLTGDKQAKGKAENSKIILHPELQGSIVSQCHLHACWVLNSFDGEWFQCWLYPWCLQSQGLNAKFIAHASFWPKLINVILKVDGLDLIYFSFLWHLLLAALSQPKSITSKQS